MNFRVRIYAIGLNEFQIYVRRRVQLHSIYVHTPKYRLVFTWKQWQLPIKNHKELNNN